MGEANTASAPRASERMRGQIKEATMFPLRTALFLVLATAASTALADQITCESKGDRPESCSTFQAGSQVRMVRQISGSPCVEGRSWGVDQSSIWVSNGCRAVFDVQPARGYGRDYASRGEGRREAARRACIDQALASRTFGPEQVRTNDVHWIGEGMIAVSLDTPNGPMNCTIDREGNVQSMDRR
jgi:hypothetical protein